MTPTEYGHSMTFISQNWNAYPSFQHSELSHVGESREDYSKSWNNGGNRDGGAHEDRNTWNNWHLIPSSRPTFAHPQQKVNTVDIPGTNGVLDLTYEVVKYPVFGNREGSFEFHVDPDYKAWNVLYSEISAFLHGRVLRVVLEDEPEYYYSGRFWVDNWASNNDGTGSTITIGYSVEPYKTAILSSVDEWLWDPFNFYTGIIGYENGEGYFVVDAAAKIKNISRDDFIAYRDTAQVLSSTALYSNSDPASSFMTYLDKSKLVGTTAIDEPGTTASSAWANNVGLYERCGVKPIVPTILWKPNGNSSGQSGTYFDLSRRLIVNYVHNAIGINYGYLSDKFKVFSDNSVYRSDGVKYIGMRGNYMAFQDDDMIFVDVFYRQNHYIQFLGNGEVKIEFNRGDL